MKYWTHVGQPRTREPSPPALGVLRPAWNGGIHLEVSVQASRLALVPGIFEDREGRTWDPARFGCHDGDPTTRLEP